MKKLLWSIHSMLLVGAVYLSPTMLSDISTSQAAEVKKESVRVPAMRNRVYTQFARAQGIADAGDKAGGIAVLDEVKERIDSLNSYEKAMLWNFYAFMYYANDDMNQAITSLEKVVS